MTLKAHNHNVVENCYVVAYTPAASKEIPENTARGGNQGQREHATSAFTRGPMNRSVPIWAPLTFSVLSLNLCFASDAQWVKEARMGLDSQVDFGLPASPPTHAPDSPSGTRTATLHSEPGHTRWESW